MLRDVRHTENFHILLWLLKDICWCLTFRGTGLIMIVPTLFLAIHITWKMRSVYSELMHNLAICFWISANSIWMIGEFFYDDGLRNYALVFFLSGLLIICIYYGKIMLGFFKKKASQG